MRIGLAYNQKPDAGLSLDERPGTTDTFAEWDEPSTIDAVERALRLFGSVIRLEADRDFPAKLAAQDVDIVFNMAEGLHGLTRESHVPAICEYLGVRYTGSDPLALGLALHKGKAKEILAFRGIPTPAFALVERPEDIEQVRLPFPLFLKPVAEGSGKGVTVDNLCRTREQLRDRALYLLEAYRQPVLVETYLPGAEFTVAVLGNGPDAHCLPIVGFRFDQLPPGSLPVYGFEAKWIWDVPERPLQIFDCPAPVPTGIARRIEEAALAAYHALGCRDWCRVDVRMDAAGTPNVIELNPLPGIIPDPAMNSCFPKAARVAGMTYDELVQEVVRIAWRRCGGGNVGAQHAAPLPPAPALGPAR
jgi:D-alanine-D-alanine ligase